MVIPHVQDLFGAVGITESITLIKSKVNLSSCHSLITLLLEQGLQFKNIPSQCFYSIIRLTFELEQLFNLCSLYNV